MATLYEINQEILSLIDFETGEISDEQRLDELQMEREKKIENIACLVKNLKSDIKEIKEEENSLATRRKSKEKTVEHLENILSYELEGAKFESARVKISWIKSTSVNILDENVIPKEFKDEKITVTVNRTRLKEALKFGEVVEGAELVQNNNIQIK